MSGLLNAEEDPTRGNSYMKIKLHIELVPID